MNHRLELARELLKQSYQDIDNVGEEYGVWEIWFFKPGSGKWAYTDYLVLRRPDRYGMNFHAGMIEQGIRETPQELRETSISSIEGWTVVALNNPLGYPIMVVGRE